MSTISRNQPEELQPETVDSCDYKIFNSMNYPVCIIGIDGLLSYGNESFKNLFGTGDRPNRLDWQHPLFPEYRKRLAQAYLGARNGQGKHCFAIMESPDGNQLPVEIYLFPLFEQEKVYSILAMLRVVDERILSFDRSTLSQFSQDNFRYDTQLFEFCITPIMRLDENMEIIKCSRSLEGFLGCSCEDIIDKKTVSYKSIFPFDAERIRQSVSEIFKGDIPIKRKGEIKVSAGEKGEKIVNLIIYPILESNEIMFVEIILEDITEIKALKERINSINRIQLLQDITKGFLHSLNNSINVIMSQTQLLLQITEKETVMEGIRTIEKSALDIVDNLRRVQNSIAKKSSLNEERMEPLVNIIEDAIEFSKMQFKVEDKEKKRNITIEKKYYTAVNVRVDTNLLREIIISIILKVSAFIQKKGILFITLKENSNLCLTINIMKNGQDGEILQLPNMVNVFSGIDIRQAAEKISLKIIEEESAEAYSIKTVFPPRMIQDKSKKEIQNSDFKIRDLDILVVEDERGLQKILFELFDRMGNRVFISGNGSEALEEFKKNHYDLVITDYGIPGITGIELAARIKEIREDITTILLSGWALDELQAYKSVVDLFIPKPFKLDDLISGISRLMRDRKKPSHQK
ncbi:MAG: hypothetical protein CVV44_18555 [Spirochaetae bacterium HGW-Spirochaetae-1]|nr:MAG: hypothetical protein CVV44_18555 [Spirochaetae bacterium HGW-Spirochaetae-1]